MQSRIDNITPQQCTGCKMCLDICPSDAISFEDDDEGFWYPKIDDSKCTRCGICYKRCPSINGLPKKDTTLPIVYSLWSKDDNVRISSTSGGAFFEFGQWFIKNGGVVVGSRYGKDWRSAEHFLAKTMEELDMLIGSKYFQSNTEGIYKQVKEYLEKGEKVLFCGTPCQNAALYSYIGRDYENLYTMDFICRSINSPKAFRAYIDELEKDYKSKAVYVHLKDKQNGWQSLASRVVFANGSISLKDRNNDNWVQGFINNDLYTRESCYQCKYKVLPRASSDLTIGDFWGIKDQSKEDMFKGISVLLINSSKGKELFEIVNSNFVFEEKRIEDVIPGNPALLNNVKENNKHITFFQYLNSGKSFSFSVRKSIGKKNVLKGIIRKVKIYYRKIFKEQISVRKYIYYNYFCKHIIRNGNAKILPHRNAVINFDKGSKIIIDAGKLEIGFNQLRGSRNETHLRLNENAVWKCHNGAKLFYDTVLEVKPNAVFESGYFSMNSGSVIITHKSITFGEDVMLGRNIIIYDSDFHSIYNKTYKINNVPKPVIIEDHVWLTTNIMVQKGVTIGKDSLIAAYTVINKDVPPHSLVGGGSSGNIIRDWVYWDRKLCPLE